MTTNILCTLSTLLVTNWTLVSITTTKPALNAVKTVQYQSIGHEIGVVCKQLLMEFQHEGKAYNLVVTEDPIIPQPEYLERDVPRDQWQDSSGVNASVPPSNTYTNQNKLNVELLRNPTPQHIGFKWPGDTVTTLFNSYGQWRSITTNWNEGPTILWRYEIAGSSPIELPQ